MAKLAALLLRKLAVAADPALQPGARGARKHVVTELFEKKEVPADTLVWAPPAEGEKCQVIVAEGKEIASFTEVTAQDRHYHKKGTEIYMVLSGVMPIEVNDQRLTVGEGDMLIVNPSTVHEVKPVEKFLARVITMDCGGGRRQVCRLANQRPTNRFTAGTVNADHRTQRKWGPTYKPTLMARSEIVGETTEFLFVSSGPGDLIVRASTVL